MKIALYVHCFFPRHFYGTEAYTLGLAKELAAAGHDPVVVSATLAGEPGQKNVIEEYIHEGVRVVSIDKNLFPNRCVRDSYEQPALRHLHERLLRRLRPDVIHVCHLISHTTALLDVARRMDIPVFATLTDFFGFCYNNQLESAEGDLCEGPDPERANCIACFLKLAGSRPNAEFIAKLGGHRVVRAAVSRQLARLGRREREPFTISSFAPNDIVQRPGILRRAMEVYREAIAPTLFLKGAYERNGFPAPLRLSHFGIEINRAPKPARHDAGAVRLGFIGQLSPHKGAHLLVEALPEPMGAAGSRPRILRQIAAASGGTTGQISGNFATCGTARGFWHPGLPRNSVHLVREQSAHSFAGPGDAYAGYRGGCGRDDGIRRKRRQRISFRARRSR
jgi:glycosyltransferase involved in cell wall biosynthesis